MTKYKVTGTLRDGKRFKAIHTDNFTYMRGINLWNGSKWQNVNGKWKRIARVVN